MKALSRMIGLCTLAAAACETKPPEIPTSPSYATDVKPILERRDPALAKALTRRFDEIDRLLDQHKAGNGYVLYTQLSHGEVKRLADAVNALSEPLSHLTAAVLP